MSLFRIRRKRQRELREWSERFALVRVRAVCWEECSVSMTAPAAKVAPRWRWQPSWRECQRVGPSVFCQWEGAYRLRCVTPSFFTLYQVTKTGLMYYRQSFDYYNHFAAFAIGALPFMKMPFMRHYFFYPILLVGFDVFGDYRSMHGQDKTAF